jgi:hypothetical protein
MVFFWEIHVFLQKSWIILSAAHRAYIQLENCDLQEAYIAKTNSFVTWKQCSRCCCSLQRWMSLERYVFLQFSRIGLFGTKWTFVHFDNYDFPEVFLKKKLNSHRETMFLMLMLLTQIVFYRALYVFFSTQLTRPIYNKDSLSPSWPTHVAGSIPFKN